MFIVGIRHCFTLATALGAMAIAGTVQAFPERPITMLIGFAPGGGADTIGRLMAQKMSVLLGQPIIIENKPGANSIGAIQDLTRAKPDGYTIMMNTASLSIAAAVYKKLPFDANKDFARVSLVATYPYLFTIPSSLAPKTFKQFLDYAKQTKTPLNYASSGVGSAPHMGMELLDSVTGLKMRHIPYKGSGPANVDLAAGRVTAMLTNYLGAAAMIQSHRFRVLAVTSARRSSNLPDVPAIAELGYPGFDVVGWYGLDAPAGTPPDVLKKLADAARQAVKDPAMLKHLEDEGDTPVGSTPTEYQTFFQKDLDRWAKLARTSNISLD
jgi:tripartite-type tricarboxylate transporter receptor subunit TctC